MMMLLKLEWNREKLLEAFAFVDTSKEIERELPFWENQFEFWCDSLHWKQL